MLLLKARLAGARFAKGEIPLDSLADLAAFREMVLEVAKWRFMEENRDRRRTPRGFTENIDLKLTGVEGGSATAVIKLVADQPTLTGSVPYQNFFSQALDAIINTIKDAESNLQSAVEHLPDRYMSYFNRIGRTLRDGECLEIIVPERQISAQLTRESRGRLLQRLPFIKRMQEVDLHGAVSEADRDKMSFQLQRVYGSKITCPMQEQHLDTVLRALAGYGNRTRVLVRCIGLFDQQNRITGLESIAHVSLLDNLDVPARLDEFRDMRDGWLEGKGRAPPHSGLDWLSDTFKARYPDEVLLPHTYPTPEGGVRMEWTRDNNVAILEIDLHRRSGNWLYFNRNSDVEQEKVLDLQVPDQWTWLAHEICNKITNAP